MHDVNSHYGVTIKNCTIVLINPERNCTQRSESRPKRAYKCEKFSYTFTKIPFFQVKSPKNLLLQMFSYAFPERVAPLEPGFQYWANLLLLCKKRFIPRNTDEN